MYSTREADPPQPPTSHNRDGMNKSTVTHSSILSWRIPWKEEHGGLLSMGPHRIRHNEVTEYACLKLRADPTAEELRINTEEAGGLEQRETEKHEPEPENKAKENATEQTGRVVGFAASWEPFSHLQMSGEVTRWGDSLKLTPSLLLGVFTKLSISAHPGPLMRAGENVTLRCRSPLLLDKFILHKKSRTGHF